LILIALLALIGGFIGSVVLSIVAVGCLNYFFTLPLFSFRVDYPQDVLALTAFLTTSIIVTGLTAKVRKMAEEAQASQKGAESDSSGTRIRYSGDDFGRADRHDCT
jgi:K+-sensing histidine kinase KdpD